MSAAVLAMEEKFKTNPIRRVKKKNENVNARKTALKSYLLKL